MAPAVERGKKSARFTWSVGTDRPQNGKKKTCKLIVVQGQLRQILEVPQRLRDVPYDERDQKIFENGAVSWDWPLSKTHLSTCCYSSRGASGSGGSPGTWGWPLRWNGVKNRPDSGGQWGLTSPKTCK